MNVLTYSEFLLEAEEHKMGSSSKIQEVYKKGTKEIDRLIMEASGTDSEIIDSMMDEFIKTKALMEEAVTTHELVKKQTKGKINEAFDAEQRFITRVIQTVKYTFTFSKYIKGHEKEQKTVNYESVLKDLTSLFPQINEALQEIIEKHTEVKTVTKSEIEGSLDRSRIELNESLADILESIAKKIRGIYVKLANKLNKVSDKIDAKLEKYKELV
jgi:hypothetical protein